jgi:hypothetical protein
VPASTEDLSAAWLRSPGYAALMAAPPSLKDGSSSPACPPLALQGSYALAQFGNAGFAHPWATHLAIQLSRQWKLMSRNLLYMRSRIMQAIIMSIVLGGLYYQRTVAQGATFFGTFLNSLMIMGFANMSEMAPAVENKFCAYRHVARGFFPPSTFVLASARCTCPWPSQRPSSSRA